MRRNRHTARKFRQPAARARGRGLRQGLGREETAFDNFMIRLSRRGLVRILHEIEHHMIPLRGREIEIDAQEHRLGTQPEISFLAQFHLECRAGRLAGLDPASRKVPSRHIGMAHEKDLTGFIAHDGAHTQRHAAREPKPQMRHAQQQPMAQTEMISFALTP